MKKSIPRIDEKKTKLKLEEELQTYREYLVTLPRDMMPSITASYSIMPASNTNEFNSKTENAAIERADYERERNKHIKRVLDAAARLKEIERKIIFDRFLAEDTRYDTEIMLDLHLTNNRYYQIKWQAMLRMAFELKVEVYHRKAREGVTNT